MFLEKKFFEYINKRRLFWWKPKGDLINVGDHLSFEIVSFALNLRSYNLVDKTLNDNKLISIGSVLHFSKTNDCIWGTGLNGKVDLSLHSFRNLDVRAVRGPLTRNYLLSKNIKCPEIYGDPGILTSLFFRKEILKIEVEHDFLIIPHMNESLTKYKGYEDKLISTNCYPYDFISKILSAKKIISSSLHGIILAESYDIPAVYLKSGNGEDDFKYHDYYHGTGRFEGDYYFAETVDLALKLEVKKIEKLFERQSILLNAFPYELWSH